MIPKNALSQLATCATFFRLGQPLEVTDDLINLLSEVVPLLIGKKSEDEISIEDLVSQILLCQESEDWLGLADYLEFELYELLTSLDEK